MVCISNSLAWGRGWKDSSYVLYLAIQMCILHCAQCELTAVSVTGKVASQSSNADTAQYLFDGKTSTFVSTGYGDSHPWIQIDLGTEHCVGTVTASLRGRCCGFYFTGASARAGLNANYTDNQPCGVPVTRAQAKNEAKIVFPCDPPRLARYVTFDIDPTMPDVTKAILQIAEVTVDEYNGNCTTNNTGVQASIPLSFIEHLISVSSAYGDPRASLDGDLYTFSQTDSDSHPWWRLDLGSEHCLGRVNVTLRQECCGDYAFTDAAARAGLSSHFADNQPCGIPATKEQSTNGATIIFSCDPPRMARYVTLDIDRTNLNVSVKQLALAEVTVDEYTDGECGSNDPATQSQGPCFGKFRNRSLSFKLVYKGGMIGNNKPLKTEMAKSPLHCAQLCILYAECFSFDFALGNGQCHLHNVTSADIEVTPSSGTMLYTLE